MDRKLSDEQIENIARNLLQDFSLRDETLDEIAESPRLWWNVRRAIETEKARREKSWFAAFRPAALAFGALLVLFCAGLAALFLTSSKNPGSSVAEQRSVQKPAEEISKKADEPPSVAPPVNREISEKTGSNRVPVKVSVKTIAPQTKSIVKNPSREKLQKPADGATRREISPSAAVAETRTDFIALSYASASDSGQIVRVKVPSSMMVSLGVKTNVEKDSELVSAEVVIGDDGLARAIRFIR